MYWIVDLIVWFFVNSYLWWMVVAFYCLSDCFSSMLRYRISMATIGFDAFVLDIGGIVEDLDRSRSNSQFLINKNSYWAIIRCMHCIIFSTLAWYFRTEKTPVMLTVIFLANANSKNIWIVLSYKGLGIGLSWVKNYETSQIYPRFFRSMNSGLISWSDWFRPHKQTLTHYPNALRTQ